VVNSNAVNVQLKVNGKKFNPWMNGPACPPQQTGKYVDDSDDTVANGDSGSYLNYLAKYGTGYSDEARVSTKIYNNPDNTQGREPRLSQTTYACVFRDYALKVPLDPSNVQKAVEGVVNVFPQQYVSFLDKFVSAVMGKKMKDYWMTILDSLQAARSDMDRQNMFLWRMYAVLTKEKTVNNGLDVIFNESAVTSDFESVKKYRDDPSCFKCIPDCTPLSLTECFDDKIRCITAMISAMQAWQTADKWAFIFIHALNDMGKQYCDSLSILSTSQDEPKPDFDRVILRVPHNFDALATPTKASTDLDLDASLNRKKGVFYNGNITYNPPADEAIAVPLEAVPVGDIFNDGLRFKDSGKIPSASQWKPDWHIYEGATGLRWGFGHASLVMPIVQKGDTSSFFTKMSVSGNERTYVSERSTMGVCFRNGWGKDVIDKSLWGLHGRRDTSDKPVSTQAFLIDNNPSRGTEFRGHLPLLRDIPPDPSDEFSTPTTTWMTADSHRPSITPAGREVPTYQPCDNVRQIRVFREDLLAATVTDECSKNDIFYMGGLSNLIVARSSDGALEMSKALLEGQIGPGTNDGKIHMWWDPVGKVWVEHQLTRLTPVGCETKWFNVRRTLSVDSNDAMALATRLFNICLCRGIGMYTARIVLELMGTCDDYNRFNKAIGKSGSYDIAERLGTLIQLYTDNLELENRNKVPLLEFCVKNNIEKASSTGVDVDAARKKIQEKYAKIAWMFLPIDYQCLPDTSELNTTLSKAITYGKGAFGKALPATATRAACIDKLKVVTERLAKELTVQADYCEPSKAVSTSKAGYRVSGMTKFYPLKYGHLDIRHTNIMGRGWAWLRLYLKSGSHMDVNITTGEARGRIEVNDQDHWPPELRSIRNEIHSLKALSQTRELSQLNIAHTVQQTADITEESFDYSNSSDYYVVMLRDTTMLAGGIVSEMRFLANSVVKTALNVEYIPSYALGLGPAHGKKVYDVIQLSDAGISLTQVDIAKVRTLTDGLGPLLADDPQIFHIPGNTSYDWLKRSTKEMMQLGCQLLNAFAHPPWAADGIVQRVPKLRFSSSDTIPFVFKYGMIRNRPKQSYYGGKPKDGESRFEALCACLKNIDYRALRYNVPMGQMDMIQSSMFSKEDTAKAHDIAYPMYVPFMSLTAIRDCRGTSSVRLPVQCNDELRTLCHITAVSGSALPIVPRWSGHSAQNESTLQQALKGAPSVASSTPRTMQYTPTKTTNSVGPTFVRDQLENYEALTDPSVFYATSIEDWYDQMKMCAHRYSAYSLQSRSFNNDISRQEWWVNSGPTWASQFLTEMDIATGTEVKASELTSLNYRVERLSNWTLLQLLNDCSRDTVSRVAGLPVKKTCDADRTGSAVFSGVDTSEMSAHDRAEFRSSRTVEYYESPLFRKRAYVTNLTKPYVIGANGTGNPELKVFYSHSAHNGMPKHSLSFTNPHRQRGRLYFSMLDAAALAYQQRQYYNEADNIRLVMDSDYGGQQDFVTEHVKTLMDTMIYAREEHVRTSKTSLPYELAVRESPEEVLPYTHIGGITNRQWNEEFSNIRPSSKIRDILAQIRRLPMWFIVNNNYTSGGPEPKASSCWIPLSVADTYTMLRMCSCFDEERMIPLNPWGVGGPLSEIYHCSYHSKYETPDPAYDATFRDRVLPPSFPTYERRPFSQYGGHVVTNDFVKHMVEDRPKFASPLHVRDLRTFRFGFTEPLQLPNVKLASESALGVDGDLGLVDTMTSFHVPSSEVKHVRTPNRWRASSFMAYARFHMAIAIHSGSEVTDERCDEDKVVCNLYRAYAQMYKCAGCSTDHDSVPTLIGYYIDAFNGRDNAIIHVAASLKTMNSLMTAYSAKLPAIRVRDFSLAAIFHMKQMETIRRARIRNEAFDKLRLRNPGLTREEFLEGVLELYANQIDVAHHVIIAALLKLQSDTGAMDLSSIPLHLLKSRAVDPMDVTLPGDVTSDTIAFGTDVPPSQRASYFSDAVNLTAPSFPRKSLGLYDLVPPYLALFLTSIAQDDVSEALPAASARADTDKLIHEVAKHKTEDLVQNLSEKLTRAALAVSTLQLSEGLMDRLASLPSLMSTMAAAESATPATSVNVLKLKGTTGSTVHRVAERLCDEADEKKMSMDVIEATVRRRITDPATAAQVLGEVENIKMRRST